MVSNKKNGVTGGGDAVSSEDDCDVDLPREQHRQAGVKGTDEVLAVDFLLRRARFGFLVEGLTFFCVDRVISVVHVVIRLESL